MPDGVDFPSVPGLRGRARILPTPGGAMYQTPRIAAALILTVLVTLPAQTQTHSTLSVKDWVEKPGIDQLGYLNFCATRLVDAVGKTDKPLAAKIRDWYAHK